MESHTIEQIVREGASSLSESSYFYWPSTGENEFPEANVTVHLGRAFLDRGFLCFAEAHKRESTEVHLDLLALNPTDGTLVLCEFKRLYSAEKIRSLTDDVHRIRDFRLQRGGLRDKRLRARGPVFGLIAGTTWDEGYARWRDLEQGDDPTRADDLEKLRRTLGGEGVDWGCCVLCYQAKEDRREEMQWLLYALFALDHDPWGA